MGRLPEGFSSLPWGISQRDLQIVLAIFVQGVEGLDPRRRIFFQVSSGFARVF